MIKLTFCLTRAPHMSREEFQHYWRNTHAPLVARHAETLRIRRYVQCHTGDEAASDGLRAVRAGGKLADAPGIYDGVAELWFESWDDLAHTGTDPEAVAAGQALLEDEMKFIDLANSPLWFGEEHVIVDR